jgi:hypothetical protein
MLTKITKDNTKNLLCTSVFSVVKKEKKEFILIAARFLVDKEATFSEVVESGKFLFSLSKETFTNRNLSAPLREKMNGLDIMAGTWIYRGLR